MLIFATLLITFTTLLVSFYIYDLSELYELKWLPDNNDNLEIANVLLSDSNNFMATLRRSDAAITEPINFEEQNWEEKVKQNSTLGHPGAGDFF